MSRRLASYVSQDLRRHEGRRRRPYHDTLGYLTIGIGRNLHRGLSDHEIEYLFRNDLRRVEQQVTTLSAWPRLDDERRAVLFNMAFQLGFGGLLLFKRMLSALGAGDYETAAVEMLDSRWAKQTPTRARELARVMRTGRRPGGK